MPTATIERAEPDLVALSFLYAPDPERIALAMERQAAVWRGDLPDRWPILLDGALTPEQERISSYNFHECFHNKDRMLSTRLREACAAAAAGSDTVPSIRANMGTGILLACIGLEQEVFPDKMPWLTSHLSRREVAALTPDDISIRGSFALALEHIAHFREVMGDRLPVFCLDTQGPFDLAHLVLGDDIFYAVYEDPPLVHHLLEVCLELGIRGHLWVKEAIGEPEGSMHHWGLYARNVGIRICEDATALLGPDAIAEFAVPYSRRLAARFGGAFVHYCGRNDHLTEAVCAMPEIRGLNFGLIPGHEHDHDFEADMLRCAETGTVYTGWWPRREGEDGRQFLRRMHQWASRGTLIPSCWPAIQEGVLPDAGSVLDYWYSL